MQFLHLTLPTLAENLALDEALLIAAEQGTGGEVVRVWEYADLGIVLGASCVLRANVRDGACLRDGVPIRRRASGGGTVLLGPGCLLYGAVLAYDRAPEFRHIGPSYCHILKRLCQTLAVPGLRPAGTSDLAIDTLKVSGNSQQRKRDHFLHHGTLLYAYDSAEAEYYLRMPPRQPDYRQGRTHGEFLTNLPLGREEIIARLREAFGAKEELREWPADAVKELVETKYGLAEWTRRR